MMIMESGEMMIDLVESMLSQSEHRMDCPALNAHLIHHSTHVVISMLYDVLDVCPIPRDTIPNDITREPLEPVPTPIDPHVVGAIAVTQKKKYQPGVTNDHQANSPSSHRPPKSRSSWSGKSQSRRRSTAKNNKHLLVMEEMEESNNRRTSRYTFDIVEPVEPPETLLAEIASLRRHQSLEKLLSKEKKESLRVQTQLRKLKARVKLDTSSFGNAKGTSEDMKEFLDDKVFYEPVDEELYLREGADVVVGRNNKVIGLRHMSNLPSSSTTVNTSTSTTTLTMESSPPIRETLPRHHPVEIQYFTPDRPNGLAESPLLLRNPNSVSKGVVVKSGGVVTKGPGWSLAKPQSKTFASATLPPIDKHPLPVKEDTAIVPEVERHSPEPQSRKKRLDTPQFMRRVKHSTDYCRSRTPKYKYRVTKKSSTRLWSSQSTRSSPSEERLAPVSRGKSSKWKYKREFPVSPVGHIRLTGGGRSNNNNATDISAIDTSRPWEEDVLLRSPVAQFLKPIE